MKTVYITGDISIDSFSEFAKKLDSLNKHEDIHIILASQGGDAEAALAYYDLICWDSRKFYIDGFGIIASAATVILAAGDIRRMGRNAYFMVHEESLTIKNKPVTYTEGHLKHCRRVEDQWGEILASRSKASADQWNAFSEKETYLSAEDCLSLGIIDYIIKEKKL